MSRAALFVRWVLGFLAATFLLIGLSFLFIPKAIMGVVDIATESSTGVADIRAVYGGLDLAIGILLGLSFLRKEWSTGLAVGTHTCACMAGGRLLGMARDGASDILTFGLLGVELLGAALAAVAWFLARQPEPASATPAPANAAATGEPTTSTEHAP